MKDLIIKYYAITGTLVELGGELDKESYKLLEAEAERIKNTLSKYYKELEENERYI